MDTKVETQPDTLEKGGPVVHPSDTESCNEQPEQTTRRRRFFIKHPWILLGAVALTWLALSHMRSFSDPRHAWSWDAVEDHRGHPLSRPPPLPSSPPPHHPPHHPPPHHPPPHHPPPHHPPPPPFADAHVDDCVENANWTFYDQPPWAPDYPFGGETAFSLPLGSDALFLISKGGFQQGTVNIEQSTEVADTVVVQVRVAYYVDKLFELATVCQIEKEDQEYGVGIFTPKLPHIPHTGPKRELKFEVTLTLPAGTGGPLPVNKLETHMPNYSQNVADLGDSVLFDTISLWSANGVLSVQSVTSEFGQFITLNGEIDGSFNALSSLDLHSTNGRVTSEVSVLHRDGANPSHLSIRTMNGLIDAEISLASDSTTGGEFEVEAECKNGEVGLKFTDTPIDSVLRCRAETTVGKVQVELDSAFEGTYSIQTMLGSNVVSERDVDDPTGQGRRRVVTKNKGLRNVEGEIKWVESDGSVSANEGHVSLKALVSSVELVV